MSNAKANMSNATANMSATATVESNISPFKIEDLNVAAFSNQSNTSPCKAEQQKNIKTYVEQLKQLAFKP